MYEIDKARFGEFLSELRREKGMTQKELAERLFLSDKAVSKWERGLSLPDVSLLIPLAECLGVSVTELLRGERIVKPELSVDEVEELVSSTIRLTTEEQREMEGDRKKGRRLAYFLCALVGAGETVVLGMLGFSWEDLGATVLLVEGLCLLFGAWLCFRVQERLPAYYDQYRVSTYSDGIFRLNLAGVRLNNSNWPHILSAMRGWLLGTMALFPILWGLVHHFWPGHTLSVELPMTLLACLGLFVPTMIAAKRYE